MNNFHFFLDGKKIAIKKNQTILDAVLKAGINLDYSCNTGSCGTCIAYIIEGNYKNTIEASFPCDEQEILTCISTVDNNNLKLKLKKYP